MNRIKAGLLYKTKREYEEMIKYLTCTMKIDLHLKIICFSLKDGSRTRCNAIQRNLMLMKNRDF